MVTIKGTDGDDHREGTDQNDTIYGGLGDDTLLGGNGNDLIGGGPGGDKLFGEGGSDTLLGGEGNDTLIGDSGSSEPAPDLFPDRDQDISNVVYYYDTNGDGTYDYSVKIDEFPDSNSSMFISNDLDRYYTQLDAYIRSNNPELENATVLGVSIKGGSSEHAQFYSVDGDTNGPQPDSGPTFNTGSNNDAVYQYSDFYKTHDPAIGGGTGGGLPGDDLIEGGSGNDSILGNEGNDTLAGDAGNDTIFGGDGNDHIDGADDADLIDGEDGNDTIFGGHGADTISGGAGDDSIDGGEGDDSIRGDDGQDTIDGGAGNDFISGGGGNDHLRGGDGDDEIVGLGGRDTLEGGDGNDFVRGSIGNDTISGDAGDDTMVGGLGDDLIYGGDGNDSINAAGGDDTVYGGAGNDTINGGDAPGNDLLNGGDDRDTFELLLGNDTVLGGSGGDDFDTLDLRGSVPEGGSYKIIDVTEDDDPGDDVDGDSSNDGIDGTIIFYGADGNEAGKLRFENIEQIIPCFTPGTLIATPNGEVRVEDLKEGDRVITRDSGMQKIRWIGRRNLTRDDLLLQPELKPVLIRKGALGYGLPERDMLVSPNHRMLAASDRTVLYFEELEVLVAAKHLTGAAGIDQVDAFGVSYIHFMFDKHEIVLSDGAWSESFQPGDYTMAGMDDEQRDEIYRLFPELKDQKGITSYQSARRTLKKHEALLLTE